MRKVVSNTTPLIALAETTVVSATVNIKYYNE